MHCNDYNDMKTERKGEFEGRTMLNPKNIQSIHCTLYVLAMKELLNPAITDNLNKTKIHQFTE